MASRAAPTTPPATPAPSRFPSPPADVVVPGSVSDVLRSVFAARPWVTPCPPNNGGTCPSTGLVGRIAICDVSQVIACRPAPVLDATAALAAVDSGGPAAFDSFDALGVGPHRVVLAADLSSDVAMAEALYYVDPALLMSEIPLAPVNPGGQGIWYADLGALTGAGRYLILVHFLEQTDDSAGVAPGVTPPTSTFTMRTVAIPIEVA